MPQALIIRGFCGSGKSTAALNFAHKYQWPFLEYDDFLWGFNSMKPPGPEEYQISWKNFMCVLSNYIEIEKSLVIEGPLVARTHEDPFCLDTLQETLSSAGYKIIIIQLRARQSVLHSRMDARNHRVPPAEEKDLMQKHQTQTLNEEIIIDTSDLSPENVIQKIEKLVRT